MSVSVYNMMSVKVDDETIERYYRNDAELLHKIIHHALAPFKAEISQKDYEDFYSLGNEIFTKAIKTYNPKYPFDSYIRLAIGQKIKTEMTRRHRKKRCHTIIHKQIDNNGDMVQQTYYLRDISTDDFLHGDKKCTVGDMIPNPTSLEDYVEPEEEYSNKMQTYLSKLSNLQRKVLSLSADGNSRNEICERLHITQSQYNQCMAAIHSPRNIIALI